MLALSDTSEDDSDQADGETPKKKRKLSRKERDEKSGKPFNQSTYKMQAITALRQIHQGLQLQSDGVACLESVCHRTPMAELPGLLYAVGLAAPTSLPKLQQQVVKAEPNVAETTTPSESEAEPKAGPSGEGKVEEDDPREAIAVWCGTSDQHAYKCSACNRVFKGKATCYSHIGKEHSGHSYLCKVCDFSTYNYDSLRAHVKKHGKE